MTCRGRPRTQYQKTTLVFPSDMTVDEVQKIISYQWSLAPTQYGPSADDAGMGDLDERIAIVLNWNGLTQAWYDQYYPGTKCWPLAYENDLQLEGRLLAYDLKRKGLVLGNPSSHCEPCVTHEFGEIMSYGLHKGIDLRGSWAEWGDEALAAYDGKIVWAGHLDNGLGTQVWEEITVPDGRKLVLRYGHLVPGSPTVRDGDAVEQGQPLGQLDNSGNSFGDHLHFEIRVRDEQAADPEPLIDFAKPEPMAYGIHGLATPDRPPRDRWDWIVSELHAMGLTYYVSLCHEVDWCSFLVDNGITPIVRFMHQQQLPDRLHECFRALYGPLKDAGVEYIQQGYNEPNLANEWKPEWRQYVTWQDDNIVRMVAQNLWLDIEEPLDAGLKPCIPPFAPTDRGPWVPNSTASSVMWPKKMLPHLAEFGGSRLADALRTGNVWVATHHSPFTYPFDYDPHRPDGRIEDMNLRGVEVLADAFKAQFGFIPKTFIRTEGGAHSPSHLDELGFPPCYSEEDWGSHVVAALDYEARHTVLSVGCNWLFGAWGNAQWAKGAWYDDCWNPRTPVRAMKEANR